MIALFAVALFVLSMPAWGWVYTCKKCGTKFER